MIEQAKNSDNYTFSSLNNSHGVQYFRKIRVRE